MGDSKQPSERQLRPLKSVPEADRIQARTIRRCGELLKQVESKQGANQNIHDATDTKVLTRTEAAAQAGLSERPQALCGRFHFKCG